MGAGMGGAKMRGAVSHALPIGGLGDTASITMWSSVLRNTLQHALHCGSAAAAASCVMVVDVRAWRQLPARASPKF